MADQELFMIQDDTDEAYAKEHAEELEAESKKHEKWFKDYIEKEKKRIKELYMVQDDTVEHYAKEHPEKLKEAEEKYGELPDHVTQKIKQEFGIR